MLNTHHAERIDPPVEKKEEIIKAKELSEDTKFTLSIQTMVSAAVGIATLVGFYYMMMGEIQEAKDRIARSESGENVYFGRDRIGRNQDRNLVEQLTTELKTLLGSAVAQANSELAQEKRTDGGSPIITNNSVVNNNNVRGGGSGGGVPYPVRDLTIPNTYVPY